MNKVILNGIDVNEALDKLEKVKDFIAYIKQAEQNYRANGWECFGIGLVEEAQYHRGYADCCLAIINNLESIIGDKE